jgi:short-subunit dehydrogenase
VLVFGASAGVGRALARALAAAGHDLVLLARDGADVSAEAAHLRTMFAVAAEGCAVDAVPAAGLPAALAGILAGPPIDVLAFPLGLSDRGDDGVLAPERVAALVDANLTAVMVVTSLVLPEMLARGCGGVVGFGSVAAIRGRSSNVAYAAAKRGLESFFESLRHRTSGTGVRVQFYRLGYVATQMSFGMKLPFPAVSPEYVARRVVAGLGRDRGLVHLPGYWRAIGLALLAVPWRLYRRMKF